MRQKQCRKGAVAPFAAVLTILLVAMVAFVVDVGYLNVVRTELQVAADAGAMAGALALSDGPAGARLVAKTTAEGNEADGRSVAVVAGSDVELGTWDESTHQFTPLTGANESLADTVRVTCQCTSARGNPARLYFARLFGSYFADVSAHAIAMRQGVCGTFIGIDSVDLNGNGAYTDSYDSRISDYDSQIPGNKGNLCSDGPIDVQNGVVNGDALPGSGDSVTIGSQGSVTGSTQPRTESLNLPAVDFTDAMANNDNNDINDDDDDDDAEQPYNEVKMEFKHNGGPFYLAPGTYYFTDFSVNGGPIIIDGPVTIFVNGDVSTSGASILNQTNKPANLKIYAAGKAVKVSGSSDFYGYVYAPSSDIEVAGSASFFGGAVGKTLKFHNDGGVHADDALRLQRHFPAQPRLVE